MKLRKNLICSILAMSLALVPNTFSHITSASEAMVSWESTFRVNMSVEFKDNAARCFVEIVGYEWVDNINNITITLWEKAGQQLQIVKEWSNLSTTGNYFVFDDNAYGVSSGHTYCVVLTADVFYNGDTETINTSKDAVYQFHLS